MSRKGKVEFSDVLRKYRWRRGLIQRELGALVGVSGNYITMLEGGFRKNPSLKLVERLSFALNISSDERLAFYSSAGYPDAEKGLPDLVRATYNLTVSSPNREIWSKNLRKVIDELVIEIVRRTKEETASEME